MAETELQLRITSSATEASRALDELAHALGRVRNAVANGLNLQTVSNGIRGLSDAVAAAQSTGAADYLTRIANALQALNRAGGLNSVDPARLRNIADALGGPQTAQNVNATTQAINEYGNALARLQNNVNFTLIGKSFSRDDLVYGENVQRLLESKRGYTAALNSAVMDMTEAERVFDEAFANRFTYQKMLPAGGQMVSSPLNDWKDYVIHDMDEAVAAVERGVLRIGTLLYGSGGGNGPIFPEEFARRFSYQPQLNGGSNQKLLGSGVNWTWGHEPKYAQTWSEPNSGGAGLVPPGALEDMTTMNSTLETFRSSLFNARDAFSSLKNEIGEMVGTSKNAGLKELSSGLQSVIPLFGRIKSIATSMLIRSAIRALTKAIHEGIANAKAYHQAIGSDIASAMETASNATFKMKNSIGAALMPVLQMLVPLLQTVTSWIITAANAINQFFALLGGATSWTRATDAAATSLDKVKTSAGGAGGAIQNLLADWDELNVIQSQGGGGGGGGGGISPIDYSTAFEQVEIFDERIRDIADFIKKNADELLETAKLIGLAILGWKLTNAFATTIPILGAILGAGTLVLDIAIMSHLTGMLTGQYLETGEEGWLLADVLTTAVGSILAWRLAHVILKGGAAGAVGSVAVSVGLAVSAIIGLNALIGDVDTSAFSEEGLLTTLENSLKLGVGAFLLGRGVFGLSGLRAAGVAAGVAFATIGVTIGIKTVMGIADVSDINSESILGALSSVAATGAGVFLTALSLGVPVPYAAIAAGVGAGATALVIAISTVAKIYAAKHDAIQWGDLELTEKQVQKYVQGTMFSVDLNATFEIISTTVDGIDKARKQVDVALTEAMTTYNVIHLGLAGEDDYARLSTEVDALVDQIGIYVNAAKEAGRLTIELTPQLVGGEAEDASQWFGNYTTGWDKVNEWAQTTGGEIGRILAKAERDEIEAGEPELLAKLMEQMSNVTSAMTGAQVNSEAFANMAIKRDALSKGTTEDIVAAFTEYRQTLEDEYNKLAIEQYTLQGQLVASLFEIEGPEGANYQQALADYEKMGANLATAGIEAANAAAAEGLKWMRELIEEKYVASLDSGLSNYGEITYESLKVWMEQPDWLQKYIANLTGIPEEILGLINSSGWEYIPDALKENIIHAFTSVGMGGELQSELEKYGIDISDLVAESYENIVNKTNDKINYAMQGIGFEPKAEIIHTDDQLRDIFGLGKAGTRSFAAIDLLFSDDLVPRVEGAMDALNNALGVDIASPDTTNAVWTINGFADTVEADAERIIASINAINMMMGMWGIGKVGINMEWSGRGYKGFASGGFPTTGSMFIARESGPELVGTMGSRSAVANNDQIVAGIAGGVAAGQSEQNNLLRQQNEYLRQLLAKESTVHVEPSSGWGKFQRRSEELYARNAGV